LGSDQPVYGLQPQGLDGKQAPLTTIEDMAARYIKEIQVIQPAGPYFLAGYCMGGTIAFEMAQQLRWQGQCVNLLALLDTYNWRMIKRTFLQDLYFSIQKWWFSSHHWLSHFFSMSTRKRFSSLKARFHELRGKSELSECNRRAAFSYAPKVYPGRLLHVRPARQFARYNTPEVGWDELVAGGMEVFFVPSCYPAQVVEEPFVRDLASKLRSCITEATAAGNRIPEAGARERGHEPVSLMSRPITAGPETFYGPPERSGKSENLPVTA
jgi:thioesterase domain-containing protein